VAINPKELEHSGQNIGINRRRPGARPSGQVGGRAETLSQCDGSGDASHFPSELKVVAAWRDAVGVADGDDRQTQQEGDQDDEEYGVGPGAPVLVFNCRRVRLVATLHEQKTSTVWDGRCGGGSLTRPGREQVDGSFDAPSKPEPSWVRLVRIEDPAPNSPCLRTPLA